MKCSKTLSVEIASVGSYLPERVLSNDDLSEMVDTSDEWIYPRTGIRERRIAAPEQATSDLAAAAAEQALARAGLEPEGLDAILVATCTPDHQFPATACLVQAALGARNALACDLEAACSGFVYALTHAAAMLETGMADNILVIGAETLSRMTDYTDRRSCILFGDGAAAALLRRATDGGQVLYTELGADGSGGDLLIIPAGGTRSPASLETVKNRRHYMKIKGPEVFKIAVNKLLELLQRIPEETGVDLADIKMVIPHQSNARIINSMLKRAGMDLGKAYMNIDRVGNTSAASIPIALAEAVEQGKLQRGDLVLLMAFGGGLTWASALLRY
ncbi:MAG: ketoacyl-ACP synthase III [Planctomycetes bacterium]|nr:ketoacyl-ACP synthase III [Planctomycetota bacterium]